ncbi:Bcr/CflA family efflux MFS transporter [Azohydromonas sediminis]|uniref:Bcr/CflA family efflux MFS transporter n=1 Tax=Azohydromonas sediminis TaxID=2259674 RepID=UPI000E658570|nr:Bcr/CflA family efflux MFS transporter [Azohydromonas sediminis]
MSAPPAATAAPAALVAPHIVALSLALLLGLQPVTTDLYLPALPLLAADLAAPMSATQLTMSALILAFGLAQLVWGPVADRWGRRPVLLGSLALFVLASVGAALAPSIGVLVGWRVAQGATMAAAVVCARAMVRDLYEPHQGAHVMSKGLSGLGLIALSSPVLGGVLAAASGWRAALAAVAAIGLATLVFVWRALPETNTRRNPQATRVGPLARTAAGVLRHPTFVAWAVLTSCTYGGLFTILASSSFVYIRVLGLSPAAYGIALGAGSVAYLAGTFACRRWLPRHGLTGTVRRGALFSLAGGLGLSAVAWADAATVWTVLVPHCLFTFAHGIHQPCGQTGAVGPFPQAAGVASALAGFVLAVTAFAVGLWLGVAIDDTVRPMAYTVGFWAVATALVAWTLVQRHGVPRSGALRAA